MAPKPACSYYLLRPWRVFLTFDADYDGARKGILKAPRVFLGMAFPVVSFILYLTLSLGCANSVLSAVSPVVVSSNGLIGIGGSPTKVDIRIGFWGSYLSYSKYNTHTETNNLPGICFGPEPYACTTSFTVSASRSVSDLQRLIPSSKGGSNTQLLRLALALQASLIVFSGIALLIVLSLSLLANAIELYFNVLASREDHMRASVWARALDWAAAAGSIIAFTTYRSNIDNTQKLLQTATGSGLGIAPGQVAGGIFGALVGTTVAGAVINTILTSSDAGRYAYKAANADRYSSADEGVGGLGKFKDDMMRRRAAYEAFP
ncbi:hypothetical protein QBC34DRAFT_142114 [Podospora aff. communis PSN243]|uniref:Uncharacterized protein n=1 Tax=Podospora aff. communis PSN243 TaxID=3040156 RepID=A0AAV9GEZ7_9PEZI|nr:hypothetical protein QBC34DRAFT_142114 [Podospora aff. communis PSN243]